MIYVQTHRSKGCSGQGLLRSPTISQNFPDVRVSLVDGDPAIRRARQIMLRSEHYDVRSYSTCAALLADPISRNYPCIVLDVAMHDIDGRDLLRQMRATGWQGAAILLDDCDLDNACEKEALAQGDTILDRQIGDRSLLAAIAATAARSDR